jgi:hypothetical protein
LFNYAHWDEGSEKGGFRVRHLGFRSETLRLLLLGRCLIVGPSRALLLPSRALAKEEATLPLLKGVPICHLSSAIYHRSVVAPLRRKIGKPFLPEWSQKWIFPTGTGKRLDNAEDPEHEPADIEND